MQLTTTKIESYDIWMHMPPV